MTRRWIWISMICAAMTSLLGCTGCSTGTQAEVARPDEAHYDAAEAEAPAAQPVAPGSAARADEYRARPQPAPAAGESYDSEEGMAPQKRSRVHSEAPVYRRPGLATRWGEERSSQIREVSFVRGSSRPDAMVSVFYDDEDGVKAATGRDLDFAYAGVFPVGGGALTISLVDSGGDPLPALQAGGRHYIFGDQGDRYAIRITNHTPGRFEVVATVDGLDVIDGGDGSTSKRGYIVNPWGSLEIEGFRDSASSVRAFRFGSVEDSYAARRGKGRNIGVIGVALFSEEGFDLPPDGEVWRRRQADPFPGRFAPPPPGDW